MEEKKCCENGMCDKCKMGSCCGYKCYGKGSMCRVITLIILVAIAFYVGTIVGGKDDFRGRMEGQRFMNKLNVNENSNKVGSDSITVEVIPETQTPPVLE